MGRTTSLLVLLVACAHLSSAQLNPADELLRDDQIRDIYLDMDPQDWQALRDNYLLDTKYPAAFTWNDVSGMRVSVRSRGSSSRNSVKPGLKIDFDNYVKDQTLGSLKSLVLDNNIQDSSLVRERTAMKLMREFGIAAPRESSARLFINGVFAGLYTAVEPIDKPFLKSRFGESSGTLYEFNTGPTPWHFEELGEDASAYVPVPFEPKTNEDSPHAEALAALIRTINRSDSGHLHEALAKVTDLDKLIRFLAIQQYLADIDGINGWNGTNNLYLYQSPEAEPRFTFIAWDTDMSFNSAIISVLNNFGQNVLSVQIWTDPVLRRMLLDSIREVAEFSGGAGGWLDREVNYALQQVAPYADQDTFIKCVDADGNPVECSEGRPAFVEESQAMRAFAAERFARVLEELEILEGVQELPFTPTPLLSTPFTRSFTTSPLASTAGARN